MAPLSYLSPARKELIEKLARMFSEKYGFSPRGFSFAPGRVNLIGEHTDYNGGFVFPAAISQGIGWVFSPTEDSRVEIYSADFDESFSGSWEDFASDSFWRNYRNSESRKSWLGYVAGVYVVFKSSYGFSSSKGMRAVFGGNLPMGGGLSSSAALENSFMALLESLSGISLECKERALLSQKAENEMVGVECGIMDQLASSCGKSGKAMFIDTKTLELRYVDVPLENYSLIVVNSSVKRELSSSEYNLRRKQCEEAAALLGVRFLRDVGSREKILSVLSNNPVLLKRALHVYDENARTIKAYEVLEEGGAEAIETFGALMYDSHFSLRYYFEVSIPQLDFIVDVARRNGALGARLVGAGFGGSAIVLIPKNELRRFEENLTKAYKEVFSLYPKFIEVSIDDGTYSSSTIL